MSHRWNPLIFQNKIIVRFQIINKAKQSNVKCIVALAFALFLLSGKVLLQDVQNEFTYHRAMLLL